MYSLIYDAAEEFGIKPLNVYKCKYYYVLSCSNGTYSFCQARPGINKIMEIHSVKTGLAEMGITNIDTYSVTDRGLPYVERDGRIYTATRFFGSNELNFMNNNQVALTLRSIGNIHRCLRSMESSMVYAAGERKNKVMEKYTRELKDMARIKKLMGKRIWDTDISTVFDSYMERAEESVQQLRAMDYGESATYCHNGLKEGNIIYKKGRVYIIDWDNMKHLSYIEDIAFFIKRYARKNCYYSHNVGSPYMSLEEAMNKYAAGRSISNEEYEILKAVFRYPHRFIDTVREGFRTGKTFLPSGVKRKLDECIAQKDFEERYMSQW